MYPVGDDCHLGGVLVTHVLPGVHRVRPRFTKEPPTSCPPASVCAARSGRSSITYAYINSLNPKGDEGRELHKFINNLKIKI